MTTTALIIGGGIAGTTAAMALHKAGLEPTVLEGRTHGAADRGAFLTIMPNGMNALAAVDADVPVEEAGFPALTPIVLDHQGQRLTESDREGSGSRQTAPRTLTRARLYELLHTEARQRGVPIEHGKHLTEARATEQGATAVFDDGTVHTADVLIGADGVHSQTRNWIDTSAPTPQQVGLTLIYGYAPEAPHPYPGGYCMIHGSQAFFGYTTDPSGTTWWFARLPGGNEDHATLETTTPEQWKRRARDYVVADATPAADIIDATGDQVTGLNAYDLPHVPIWQHNTMTLVGDAAHAASPASAQGASMALEGAVVLGQCLRDKPVHEALAHYEHLRRDRAERVVGMGRSRSRNTPNAESPLAAWIINHHIEWDSTT